MNNGFGRYETDYLVVSYSGMDFCLCGVVVYSMDVIV